jgi:pimeloyl-ACP methyl ester carboxylesterase
MAVKSIYMNEQGKGKLQEYYENYLHSFDEPLERIYVDTRFGKTHVLAAGPKNGKPIFILQGGNCVNPMTLSWFSSLIKQYRIYAPDTIGHPGFSDETRISGKDNSYALWISDIMNHLKINQAAFAGSSFGGGVILRLAAYFPEKMACAVLFAPAGLILGSKVRMIREILLPLLQYKKSGAKKHIEAIAKVMSDGKMKPVDAEITGEIFRSVKLERDMPKITPRAELQKFSAPTLVIGGTNDIFFPGERLIAQAQKVIPGFIRGHLHEMGHFPSEENLKKIDQELAEFLKEYY